MYSIILAKIKIASDGGRYNDCQEKDWVGRYEDVRGTIAIYAQDLVMAFQRC